jgi:hypothetical protein
MHDVMFFFPLGRIGYKLKLEMRNIKIVCIGKGWKSSICGWMRTLAGCIISELMMHD